MKAQENSRKGGCAHIISSNLLEKTHKVEIIVPRTKNISEVFWKYVSSPEEHQVCVGLFDDSDSSKNRITFEFSLLNAESLDDKNITCAINSNKNSCINSLSPFKNGPWSQNERETFAFTLRSINGTSNTPQQISH